MVFHTYCTHTDIYYISMYPLCNATATPQARSCSDLLLHFIVMKRATKDRHRMPSKLRPPAAKPTYLPTYLSASRPPAAKKPTYLPFVRAYPDLRRSKKNRTLSCSRDRGPGALRTMKTAKVLRRDANNSEFWGPSPRERNERLRGGHG